MLVAGTVSVNSSGTQILLKDTSIMPDIPGLPALLTMLFTPIMELCTNEEGTCYIGALCGLGWNSQTQKGILPENDIELAFDVKFDAEDIIQINALRAAINRLVCEGVNGTLHLGPNKIAQLQEDCQDRLIGLFTKSPPREAVTPMEKYLMWNQELNVEPGSTGTRDVLFQLHPFTPLNS
ncbi:ATP-dependent RNA helicase TDRD9 isoform X2 [Xyrichtys novacula]|uniref:ATP-dependent RNA helicase TDRD9 isoform X2 n=1 Tax=Xyrichtys novacula TaxID=13765 RepID=A0AAV1GJE0_XYRNO|nr:ATP-dependent RNA helicase TDRD9 isoform X2 [Xyrichtys novacula]